MLVSDRRKHKKETMRDIRDLRPCGARHLLQQPEIGWFRAFALVVGDAIALSLAGHLAAQTNLAFSPLPPQLNWGQWLGLPGLFWTFVAITILAFMHHSFYASEAQWRNYMKQAQVISSIYLASLVVSYFYDPTVDAPRSLFLTAWFASIGLVLGFRLILTVLLSQFHHPQYRTPAFIIAPGDRLELLTEIVEKRTGYRVVGALLSSLAHTPSAMQTILRSGAREVIAEDLPETQLASGLYWELRNAGIGLRLIPSSVMMLHRRGMPEIFAGLPTVRIEPRFLANWDYRCKRLVDFLGALLGLIVLSPLFVLVSLAIAIGSPGGVFYSQERIGLHGQVFRMWKFRSMVPDAERRQAELEHLNKSKDGVMFKLERDPRIIPAIGHLIRRLSIDELPQLFNVLVGQMSLVGPRPLPLRDVRRFGDWHHTRHLVVPGITGLWQISGRSDIDTIDDVARLDLFYIDHWSLNLDLEILVETVRIVLFGKGAY